MRNPFRKYTYVETFPDLWEKVGVVADSFLAQIGLCELAIDFGFLRSRDLVYVPYSDGQPSADLFDVLRVMPMFNGMERRLHFAPVAGLKKVGSRDVYLVSESDVVAPYPALRKTIELNTGMFGVETVFFDPDGTFVFLVSESDGGFVIGSKQEIETHIGDLDELLASFEQHASPDWLAPWILMPPAESVLPGDH